jgi:hypothetical protein
MIDESFVIRNNVKLSTKVSSRPAGIKGGVSSGKSDEDYQVCQAGIAAFMDGAKR